MSSAKLGVEAVKAISLLAAPVVDKAVAALGSQPIKAAERLAVEQASLIFASTVFRAAQAAASTVPRTEKQDQPSQNVEVKNPVPGRAADLGGSSHGATRKQGSSSTTGQVIAGQLTNLVIDSVASNLQSRFSSGATTLGASGSESPQTQDTSAVFRHANEKNSAGPRLRTSYGVPESSGFPDRGARVHQGQTGAKPGSDNHGDNGGPPKPPEQPIPPGPLGQDNHGGNGVPPTPPRPPMPPSSDPSKPGSYANLTAENIADWSKGLDEKYIRDQMSRHEQNAEFRRILEALTDALARTKDAQQRLSQVAGY